MRDGEDARDAIVSVTDVSDDVVKYDLIILIIGPLAVQPSTEHDLCI